METIKDNQNEIELKNDLTEFLNFQMQEAMANNETSRVPKTVKRKRKNNDSSLMSLTEVFLRLIYPLTSCLSKNIIIGIFRSENYKPLVQLQHANVKLTFNENAWLSFNSYLHLITCYFKNKIYGKKTNIILSNCDITIDNIKNKGEQTVRFKHSNNHVEKILLTEKEFQLLIGCIPAINKYLNQLKLSEKIIKNYLTEAVDNIDDNQILSLPTDMSIFNRLPQEAHLFRHMKSISAEKVDNEIYQEAEETEALDGQEVKDDNVTKKIKQEENLSQIPTDTT